eukprot:COSAG02_NODE_1460_length_12494_cov_126.207422_13_plen_1401_part_00
MAAAAAKASDAPVDIKWVSEPSTGRGRTAFRQAKALFQDGHVEEALRMYTQVRDSLDRSDSYWAICHNQMGLCYSKLGNDAEAIKSYTTAIQTGEHKDMHIWHMNRAVKLKVSGDFERAKDDFERVIQLRADSPQAQKAKDHLVRMQSPVRYSPVVESHGSRADCRADVNSHRSVRKHVIDLWNRLATAFGEANDGYPSSPRTETPPDAVCCSLLLLGDLDILKWFLLGTVRPASGAPTGLGSNPWKAQGWIDDVDVLARLSPYSIPIISGWLGDMCESGNVTLASRSTAVRKWLSNDSVVKSAPVSMNRVEARLCDATLEHCAAISGDVRVLQWFNSTFADAREKRLQDLAAKVEVDPDDAESIALLSAAVVPAPKANRGETPDSFIPDRTIAAVAHMGFALQSPGAEGHFADTSKDARKYLSDMYTSVERYRLQSACTKGIPLGIYLLFWTLEAFAAYHIVLCDIGESFQALHHIPWYACAVVLFAFSWLIPGLRDVGPIPGWLVQGVPAVLWGGALATFCVIQMLTAFQQLGNVLPEYADWTHACTGMLLFLGYLVPHTQPLSSWSSALAYGHSISWSLLVVYLVNQVAWGSDEVYLESDGFFLVVQAAFFAMSAFHPCQFPPEEDQDYTFKTLLVWSYTMLWRLLVAFFTAGMGEWMFGHFVPTIMYSLAMLQTGCLSLLITYTTLWYSFDADKNVAKQAYVKARLMLYKLGLVQPLNRPLKDDLRDWRARTIKDRLATELQETLAIVQSGFGAPKALTRYDCANPRSPQKRQFNLDYLRATKLVDDEIDLAALGETLDPDLAQHMLTLTDKLQDYIFGCLNACLTRHDKLMRGVPPILSGSSNSSEQADPVFFDEVVGMLMFLIDEGGRWEKRFADGDCDGPTVADRRELAIGRAWLANVPAQRVRIMQAWERARQDKLDADKARQEEARLRQLEEAKRAAEAEVEREKMAELREQQRKEEAKKAAERRLLEEARLAEQAKVEEANRKKREEARLQRQKEAAALKDAQRREQMLATKKKQLETEETKAQKLLRSGDPSGAAKAFSKAIRVATDLNDDAEIERLKQNKQDALSAAATLAEQAKAKAAEEKARRKAAEEERKLAAAAERERLEKLEQQRQEQAAARALAERRAKHDATIERIEKAVAKTQEMLDRGEGTQAVRAIEKVPTLMQMLDSQFGGGISQEELAELQAKCKAAEVDYIKKSAAKAEQKKKEAAERRKKQEEEKAAAEKKAAEEKEAAEAAAAVAAAKAAEEEAEREKAKIAAEAAAFEAQMAEYALKDEEQLKEDEQTADGENRGEESLPNGEGPTVGSTSGADGSAPQGDFNIEMALGRDLLGDLGMDDDDLDGRCECELPQDPFICCAVISLVRVVQFVLTLSVSGGLYQCRGGTSAAEC